jgi:hypothetical protein
LGAFPGTIHGFGLMFFAFKLLPSDKEVPSTGTYCQSLSKKKAMGSSRHLAEAEADWACTMSLPSSLEEAMVFLFFLFLCQLIAAFDLLCHILASRRRRS